MYVLENTEGKTKKKILLQDSYLIFKMDIRWTFTLEIMVQFLPPIQDQKKIDNQRMNSVNTFSE